MLIVWTGSGEAEPFLRAFLHLCFNYFDPDQLISLFFFTQRKIQLNSRQIKMIPYKPRESVKSAHWTEATKVNTGRKCYVLDL